MLVVIALAMGFLIALLAVRQTLARSALLRSFGRLSPFFFCVHCLPLGLLGVHRFLGLSSPLSAPVAVALGFLLSLLLALLLRWISKRAQARN